MKNENKVRPKSSLRENLIKEAIHLFNNGGARTVTMRALGSRTGVSQTAVYRHFKDKADLLDTIAGTGYSLLHKQMQSVLADPEIDGVDQLRLFGEIYIKFAVENPVYYRLMYGEESSQRWGNPVLKAPRDALHFFLLHALTTYFSDSDIPQDDLNILVYVAWTSMHGLASVLVEGQIISAVDKEKIQERTIQTVIDGFGVYKLEYVNT